MDPLIHPGRQPGEEQRLDSGFVPLGLAAMGVGIWLGAAVVRDSWAGLAAGAIFFRLLACVFTGSLTLLGGMWVVGPFVHTQRFQPLAWWLGGTCLGIAAFFLALVVAAMLGPSRDGWWWADVVAALVLGVGALDLALLSALTIRRAWRPVDGPIARRALYVGVMLVPLWITVSFAFGRLEQPANAEWVAAQTCVHQVRRLCMILSERSMQHGWPPDRGKAFVTSLLEDGTLDAEDPNHAAWILCPLHAGAHAADGYFTSYAGRRNDEDAYRLTPERLKETKGHEPIVACLRHAGGAIVGFADGWAQFMDREALGLGPGDPIVVGEASKSPILRKLCDE